MNVSEYCAVAPPLMRKLFSQTVRGQSAPNRVCTATNPIAKRCPSRNQIFRTNFHPRKYPIQVKIRPATMKKQLAYGGLRWRQPATDGSSSSWSDFIQKVTLQVRPRKRKLNWNGSIQKPEAKASLFEPFFRLLCQAWNFIHMAVESCPQTSVNTLCLGHFFTVLGGNNSDIIFS